jgi:oxygen-independent coproporphyrinogen-3 oxidase
VHVYIHVPFCARRCSYCDFAIAVRSPTPDAQFVSAITHEWDQRVSSAEWPADRSVRTIYFGGGTPSRLEPTSIAQLIALVARANTLEPDAEITLECNPDDVTPAGAAAWAAAGVNRVSLGVQSHDAAVLEWMHRTHQVAQVPAAVGALRDAGITNISMDLIFALPAELRRDWNRDLDQTLALRPTHVSLYGLTFEPHTPLFHWARRGAVAPPPDERYAAEYLEAHERLVGAGFEHYEVSNAALPGHRSRHNLAYWSGVDYLGLGPSAHSFRAGERRWNVREWADYLARVTTGQSLVAGTESIDAGAARLERRYLGLRTSAGLPLADLPSAIVDTWIGARWAEVSGSALRLTAEGWLRLDALVGAAHHS